MPIKAILFGKLKNLPERNETLFILQLSTVLLHSLS